MTWSRLEPENNLKIRPETQPEYSQTCPKPVGPGRVGRVFGWARSIAQSYLHIRKKKKNPNKHVVCEEAIYDWQMKES